MRRTIGWTIAICAIFITTSQAQTNDCTSAVNGFWQDASLWSLAVPPSLSQSAALITNGPSETITIDSTTASGFASTLTISNLNISTDTLSLNNAGATALHILNSLTIGITFNQFNDEFSIGGALLITNSTVIVDGVSGGQIQDNGTIAIVNGSLIATNCSFQIAVSADNNSFGILLVSNGWVQARDVSVANSIGTGSGQIIINSGTMTVSSNMLIGASSGSEQGFLTLGNGSLLVVTNSFTDLPSGMMTVSNSTFLGGALILGTFHKFGTLVINNGTVNLNEDLDIATDGQANGSATLNGGMLVVTNNGVFMGSSPGIGHLTVSNGVFLGQSIFLTESTVSIQGGTSILSSYLDIGFGGVVTVNGGQLLVTNGPTALEQGAEQLIVSNGLLAVTSVDLETIFNGTGTISVSGGSLTSTLGVTAGDCDNGAVGQIVVSGGQLIATNNLGHGFIDMENGQFKLSGGVVQVDNLIMTNSCGRFLHTGGTLIAQNVLLDPNAFEITSVAREGNDLRITWLMGPGQSNVLQSTAGGIGGSYATNGFADIFVVTNNAIPGALTNYLDVGAATNIPSRYYRARLVP